MKSCSFEAPSNRGPTRPRRHYSLQERIAEGFGKIVYGGSEHGRERARLIEASMFLERIMGYSGSGSPSA
jgi:hypothetical protein